MNPVTLLAGAMGCLVAGGLLAVVGAPMGGSLVSAGLVLMWIALSVISKR